MHSLFLEGSTPSTPGLKDNEQERERLFKLNLARTRLVDAAEQLSLACDLESIMVVVRRTARQLTGADGTTFIVREGEFCHYADEDGIGPLWQGRRFALSECVSGWVMLNRQAVVMEDISAEQRLSAGAYRPTFVKSLAMVPLGVSSPTGAIGAYWAEPHLAAPEEIQLLQGLANITALAVNNVRLHAELEDRVLKRTAELKKTSEELEAFSYSVSHDLTGPLLQVQGYLALLKKHCGAQLDHTANGYLTKVQKGAERMTRLTQDLLRLSNSGRSALLCQRVDLSKLAGEIAATLSASAPERRVNWLITEGLAAEVDPGLIQVALDNLLSNAWKYTMHCPEARIEFGVVERAQGPAEYYIRDNGAGFDMEFAGELFQALKRLHSRDEFPGSGIGLATVRRIIERHGGQIRAQGAVGQGAVFHFTLGAQRPHGVNDDEPHGY
jgi:signal transduction histidine kinase